MKKLILLLFIPLVSFGQILYGLKKTENGSTTIPFDVVNIDPLDGSTSIVLSTNSLIGVAAGATTYDQMNSRYICWGYDNQNNQKVATQCFNVWHENNNEFNAVSFAGVKEHERVISNHLREMPNRKLEVGIAPQDEVDIC